MKKLNLILMTMFLLLFGITSVKADAVDSWLSTNGCSSIKSTKKENVNALFSIAVKDGYEFAGYKTSNLSAVKCSVKLSPDTHLECTGSTEGTYGLILEMNYEMNIVKECYKATILSATSNEKTDGDFSAGKEEGEKISDGETNIDMGWKDQQSSSPPSSSSTNSTYDYGDKTDGSIGDSFCSETEVKNVLKLSGTILMIAKLAIPLIIVGIAIFDLYKSIVSGKQDELAAGAKKIVIRIGIGVLVFFIPNIMGAFLGEFLPDEYTECSNCLFYPNDSCALTDNPSE